MKKCTAVGGSILAALIIFCTADSFRACAIAALREQSSIIKAGNLHLNYKVVGEGASLIVGNTGELALHGRSSIIAALARTSGLWIRDTKDGATYLVNGNFKEVGGIVEQTWTSKAASLRVEVRYKPVGNHFRVTGYIADVSGHNRCIDITLSLSPARTRKGPPWLIWRGLQSPTLLSNAIHRQTIYPLAVASQPQTERAFALAIPPSAPTVFESEASKVDGVRMSEAFGITHAGRGALAGRVPFAFDIYPVNAEWGMRDALAKYYAAYPAVFRRRTRAAGLWLRTNVRAVPNPGDYSFREGGLGGIVADEQAGVITFPYVIVGQRELTGLPALPKNYAQMMSEFGKFHVNSTRSKGWGKDVKEVIRNSAIFNVNGKIRVFARQPNFAESGYVTSTPPIRLTFPLNPNPMLFLDHPNRVTVAKAVLGWVNRTLRVYTEIGGIYVDSLGKWGHYLNYRLGHFPYEKIPLTCGPGGQPAIANKFSQLEFLWALGRVLHKHGKLIWGNGINQHRIFNGFALDVLGLEIGPEHLLRTFRFARTVADKKPYLVMDNRQRDWLNSKYVAEYWRLSTLYDVFPGFGPLYEKNPALYRRDKSTIDRYLPILRKMAVAGWQPVTDATLRVNGQIQSPWAKNPHIFVERYGSVGDATLYFSAYNNSSTNSEITLRPARSLYGGLVPTRAKELLHRTILDVQDGAIRLAIPSHALRVIAVNFQD